MTIPSLLIRKALRLGAARNGIWHPTGRQRWGRQRDALPLRWSLADPVASVAMNRALQKELFAWSPLPRCRGRAAYKEPRWPRYEVRTLGERRA